MTQTDIRDDVASAGAPVAPGTMIAGRYRVLEQLERYGVPAGYRVRHTLLDSVLVLTALPPQRTKEAGFLARVQAVVRQAGQLRHDHLLPVLDLVEDGERYFLVEPFVDAVPLDHMVRDQPLAPPDALLVARQLADALAYAHEHGVVHGAVSPANVWIERGRPPRALLGGFGHAALAWNASAGLPASLPYTAPERIVGAEVDVCTDIFTIGLLVFELFEGRALLSGTAREVEALLRGTGPLVPRFSGLVPAGVSALVGRAVRRTPGARQQKMAHVRVEIDACLRAVGQAPGAAAAP